MPSPSDFDDELLEGDERPLDEQALKKIRQQMLKGAKSVSQYTALNEGSWEYEVVRDLMTRLQLDRGTRDLIWRFGEQETGRPKLLLAGLMEYLQLPYHLEATVLQNASTRCQLGHIFSKPNELEFVTRYLEVRSAAPESGLPVVLICKWPYLKQGMAVHELTPPEWSSYVYLAGQRPLVLEPWLLLLRRMIEQL